MGVDVGAGVGRGSGVGLDSGWIGLMTGRTEPGTFGEGVGVGVAVGEGEGLGGIALAVLDSIIATTVLRAASILWRLEEVWSVWRWECWVASKPAVEGGRAKRGGVGGKDWCGWTG